MELTITQSLTLLPIVIFVLVKLLNSDYNATIEIEEVEVREQRNSNYGRVIQTMAEIH
ncbi:hypothetical protein Javan425_0053 [Streptococcus phage Javan425]|uniref:Phage membrane protein n=1 Tax=Streptococcus porcinus str. Jelinkova 176 TaxID=873448 RepID=A0ABN0CV25_STRPO|nr:hypothetical protein [Streptococcus porcinus]EGJ27052.1 hypothetical protein STRPO_0250 [Streptococcus porcinus str. Jelinkova 176]QBX18352.1 hypothetical protein Javan423_0006 [Streptococcus phage Javan423]QBX18458.1 hypothetical protein Javan425_0053 [Streptococcus phage Javan425]SQG43928.1 Uncharacterised protein [Streptococcus porcinus]